MLSAALWMAFLLPAGGTGFTPHVPVSGEERLTAGSPVTQHRFLTRKQRQRGPRRPHNRSSQPFEEEDNRADSPVKVATGVVTRVSPSTDPVTLHVRAEHVGPGQGKRYLILHILLI
jgi:hypothetical protein